ncbi:MAG TPA: flagellar basal body P-ring protein FlgI [Anaeromyxobacter sp.]|nr:flagellar basal body P-ring protein FlgI [Anaeromyxobacter sp.]
MRALLPLLLAALAAAPLVLPAAPAAAADAVRVKDLGKLRGWRENALVGYGIVTGLAGTGDSPTNRTTRQALSNVFSRFNLTVPADQVQSRNVAVVMVSAALPTFAREGDTVDVTVTSAGDARSLVGGSLLVTPLEGPNGRVYALAQGPLSVGGYRYDANGNVVQKNHPTVGSIPNGATVELAVNAEVLGVGQDLTFVLTDPDYTTASAVAAAIDAQVGAGLARARDASAIEVKVPDADRDRLVTFVARLENVTVAPDRRARVVIDERSGTVVVGGDVRIAPVAISHGDLKVSITDFNSVSLPTGVIDTGRGVRTAFVTNTRVEVDEPSGAGFVPATSNTVADLVQSLARLKVNTRDTISILRAIKAAGALHAELVVQ